ncbi:hypothetical protein [Sphingomonas corticis]|uniref:Uncharacterized protein n=1 Tax=Sphingomonas corticis TaxID=2722791 RepID=A0ABX1CMG2_9SPHN|nr:hypothetical protein [Sphingomonas corticis]NJR79169.1 hypothetical protein [Sphingomonas corticis]
MVQRHDADAFMTADGDDWRDDPRWLELTLEKRAAALTRMAVIERYLSMERRSAQEADRCAAELGIGRSRFYGLCKLWERSRSPVPLAPYSEPVVPKRPSVKAERAAEIETKVGSALASTRDRTPNAIVDTVARDWGEGTAPPARETLRRFVMQAIAREETDGGEVLRREANEVARGFGEVVVFDHCLVDIFADDGPLPRRPTLTLAIDLFTGAPIGHAVAMAPPGPGMIVAAIEDATRRSASLAGDPVRPRIIVGSSYSADWTRLIERFRSSGIVMSGRRSPQLPFGAPTARLVGPRLGRLRLLARAGHEEDGATAGFDPAKHPVLTIEQARSVIVTNIASVLADRLGEDGGRPLQFDLVNEVDGVDWGRDGNET